jgi:hypothetical protein
MLIVAPVAMLTLFPTLNCVPFDPIAVSVSVDSKSRSPYTV